MPEGRERANMSARHSSLVNARQLGMVDSLAQIDSKTSLSSLVWLKAIPVAAKADNVRDILERLSFVRAVGIPAANSVALHPGRVLPVTSVKGVCHHPI